MTDLKKGGSNKSLPGDASSLAQKQSNSPLKKELVGIMKPIPSTHIPIFKLNGKTYHCMCKEDIAQAIIDKLEVVCDEKKLSKVIATARYNRAIRAIQNGTDDKNLIMSNKGLTKAISKSDAFKVGVKK
jgi:hypothetical protein